MNKIDNNVIRLIINDLINRNDTQQMIAERYLVSKSLVEKINTCKIYTEFHEYKNNIRREAKKINLKVVNKYVEQADYYDLIIIRTDQQQVITKISKQDFININKYTWTFKLDQSGNYRIKATSNVLRGKDLSTWLLNGNLEKVVDHINRDTLDNRRENLRLVTRSINSSNAKARSESKTNIRGVYKRKERPGIAKESWICEWSDSSGRHTKSFSVEKYGEEEAFRLAKSLREEKMKEMKI